MWKRSKTLLEEATARPTGGCKLRFFSTHVRGVRALRGALGGITAGGRTGARVICADSGATHMLNPAADVMAASPKQAPPISTMSGTRGVKSGALRKAVLMLVRGQRVMVTIRVSREARDLSLRGLAARIDVPDEGGGIGEFHMPRLTGRFCRANSHRARAKGGTGPGLATSSIS